MLGIGSFSIDRSYFSNLTRVNLWPLILNIQYVYINYIYRTCIFNLDYICNQFQNSNKPMNLGRPSAYSHSLTPRQVNNPHSFSPTNSLASSRHSSTNKAIVFRKV